MFSQIQCINTRESDLQSNAVLKPLDGTDDNSVHLYQTIYETQDFQVQQEMQTEGQSVLPKQFCTKST